MTTTCLEHHCPTRECEGVVPHRTPYRSLCRCRHPQKVHEHYSASEHCAICSCPEYSNPDALRWIVAAAVAGALILAAAAAGIWAVARMLRG